MSPRPPLSLLALALAACALPDRPLPAPVASPGVEPPPPIASTAQLSDRTYLMYVLSQRERLSDAHWRFLVEHRERMSDYASTARPLAG